jgi:biotin/methionine sulfoxide reductase
MSTPQLPPLAFNHWGLFHPEVEGDRVVGLRPFTRDPQPVSFGVSLVDAVHSPLRIPQPMVRAAWLERGPGPGPRGAGAFVPGSWERALELVAGEVGRVREQHGNESIYAGSYGWGSACTVHNARQLLHRYLNLLGGFTDGVGNYSAGAAFYILPYVLGGLEAIVMPTDWRSIAQHTELLVAFGGLPPKNAQADLGGAAVHETAMYLRQLARRRVECVYIGPLRDDMAGELGAQWLPARPNTDIALMLGLAHTLYVEGLWSPEFVGRYSVGFEKFLPYLLGARDGQPKDAGWAAAITEVPAEDIRALARRMAQRRTLINGSLSVQRQDHGEQPYWMLVALAAMLGQIGLPGGGFGFGYGTGGTGAPRRYFPVPRLSAGQNPTGRYIPVARISDMLLNPGGVCPFNGETIRYPDVRLIYWVGGNPFHHHQDLGRLLRGWQRPDTVVVHDAWWTPVARHADIVLPCVTALERDDVSSALLMSDRYIVANRAAIPPVGQARAEFDIFAALAGLGGVGDAFTEGRDARAWIRHVYEEARTGAARVGVELPDFDAFWRLGYVEIPPDPEPHVMLADFRADPEEHRLKTPSGRIEIFSEAIAGFGYADCPPHPTWLEPAEWLGSPAAARYPLHLVTNQPRTRLHSQLDMGRVSQASKIAGRESLWMHPRDAAHRGLKEGDVVRVESARGACLAGLHVTDLIRPGVVQLATGAWYDPAEPGVPESLCKHGNPNAVTLDKGTSALAQAPISQTTLVEVSRCDNPPPVTAFTSPPLAPPAG